MSAFPWENEMGQQGHSERRGEEVRTALRGAVRPCNRS